MNDDDFPPWQCLSRESVLDRPPWLRLEEHHLRLPGGKEIPDWLWVVTPDFINVVAVTKERSFLCFRQTKYAVEGPTLALVGGYLSPGEDARAAAARELLEETGYQSNTWSSLGSFAIDGNRGCGRGHLFLAENCVFSGKTESDDLETQQLLRLTHDEVRAALLSGAFGVLPWTAALALALLRMEA